MLEFEQQLHGYQQGHQLLDSTVKLPRRDQDLIDRLSDIAGPLRPGEKFDPYLTCYPLPSGTYYVIARTWQDLAAPRAGCVRTRSALVPMHAWLTDRRVVGTVGSVTEHGPRSPASKFFPELVTSLPRVDVSEVFELTEALFLERRAPIVVFDSSAPEAIALRILSGTWLSFRKSFSVCTFALSPRLLEDKSFDLVFAPISAKGRFSDWGGRRIDARTRSQPRHRWSVIIASKLFIGDGDLLKGSDIFEELSANLEVDESVLRLSLLWNELYEKIGVNSNAALGLLDIANSLPNRGLRAIQRIAPSLAIATEHAVTDLAPKEAWRFLLAISEKLAVTESLNLLRSDVDAAAKRLAESAPLEAVEACHALINAHAPKVLLSACAEGIARKLAGDVASALSQMEERDFLSLLLSSRTLAEKSVAWPELLSLLSRAIESASPHEIAQSIKTLLPLLVSETQFGAASLLISQLTADELLQEVQLLSDTDGLSLSSYSRAVLMRAEELGAREALRDLLATLPRTPGTDQTLLGLLEPTPEDLGWVRHSLKRSKRSAHAITLQILQSADQSDLDRIVSSEEWKHLLPLLLDHPSESQDILRASLVRPWCDPEEKVAVIAQLLPSAARAADRETLADWLQILLKSSESKGRQEAIALILSKSGGDIPATSFIQMALGRRVEASIFDANLAMLCNSTALRQDVCVHVDAVAQAIVSRGTVDFRQQTAEALGALLWECATRHEVSLEAYARLMRFLMWQRSPEASPLFAAVFPVVYVSLDEVDEASDLMGFFRVFEFDRKKSLRGDLVDAFLRFNWRPIDLGIAAARTGDSLRILARLVDRRSGKKLLAELQASLTQIPEPWRKDVTKSLKKLGV